MDTESMDTESMDTESMDTESTPPRDDDAGDGPQETAPPLPDDPRVPHPEDAEPTRSKELGGAAPAVGPETPPAR